MDDPKPNPSTFTPSHMFNGALIAWHERQNKRLRSALSELVRLKDLHDASEDQTYWATRAVEESTLAQLHAWRADYEANKPKAWEAARHALAQRTEL